VVDWEKYNKTLVRRGEVLLGFDVIDNWNNELEKMNMMEKRVLHMSIHIPSFSY
jgi:hypothetical protein